MAKIVFIFLFGIISCFSQPVDNQLSSEQFYEIELNNIPKLSIEKTNGDISLMKSLFGDPQIIEDLDEAVGEFGRCFIYNSGLEVCFHETIVDCEEGKTKSMIEVSYINATSIKVLGVELKINDNINKLKGVKFNIRESGISVSFIHLNGDCCPIIIRLDEQGRVIKIEYLIYT